MEAESRDAFTLLFNQQFAANLAKGLHKSQAAAEALTATQRLLAVRQSPTAVSQPLPHSNTHSATSTTNSDTGTSIPTAIHPPPIKVSPAVTPPLPPVSKVEPVVKAKPLPLPLPVKIREPVRVSSSILQALVEECQKTSSYTPIIRLIGDVFSSVDKLSVCFAPTTAHTVFGDQKAGKEHTCDHNGSDPHPDSMDVSDDRGDEELVHEQVDEKASVRTDHVVVDMVEVSEVYALLQSCQPHSEGVGNSLLHALESLSYNLLSGASACTDPEQLRLYLVVFENPLLQDAGYAQVVRNILQALDRLPPRARLLLSGCFRDCAFQGPTGPPRFTRLMMQLRLHSAQRLRANAVQDARNAVRAVSLLHDAVYHVPSDADQKEGVYASPNVLVQTLGLSSSSFYLEEVCDLYMATSDGRKREYKLWRLDLAEKDRERRRSAGGKEPEKPYQCQSMISFPYVLTPATKAAILELDANVEMRQVVNQEYDQAVASGSRYMIPYLVMRIRRSHIMEDTLNHFVAHTDSDFKKPLKVVFDNEEGIDEGGVRKEYYQIMMKQLLDPNYGMFKYYDDSRLLWFNSDSFESDMEFEVIGILLGVAIYNAIIVDFQMPRCIYKKLMGAACTLEDLRELQPDLARGLGQILSCESVDSFNEVFSDLNFQITYETLGERRDIDLKEGGSGIPVTFETREEYVSLYVSYLLEESVQTQFTAFARGFRKVCGGAALDLFNAEELELLICGNPTLDTHDLEAGTRYEDGYTGDEEVVQWFWETLHDFSEEDKRSFLRFISGSDRSPIDGLSKLHFVVSRNGDDESRLPSAHTCFNHMLLPQYSTKEILREKMLYAMRNAAQGFGLI